MQARELLRQYSNPKGRFDTKQAAAGVAGRLVWGVAPDGNNREGHRNAGNKLRCFGVARDTP